MRWKIWVKTNIVMVKRIRAQIIWMAWEVWKEWEIWKTKSTTTKVKAQVKVKKNMKIAWNRVMQILIQSRTEVVWNKDLNKLKITLKNKKQSH